MAEPAAGGVPDLLRVPGPVNAHSHAFHRILRGRTHEGAAGGAGSFWTWRDKMYRAAAELAPESYERLATAVFAEMAVTGWTAVGEFHYLHHAPGGRPYGGHPDRDGAHAMELAVARAALAAGIRLVLLDTCYIDGGLSEDGAALPLDATQRRFSDGGAAGWLKRVAGLRGTLAAADAGRGLLTLGAAIHSVRAVPPAELDVIADGLDAALGSTAPLHIHLSEQPAENAACLAAHGTTPAGLLARHGLLDARLSAVHATHLTAADTDAIGAAGACVVMCPSTEADLADGIGPARELADAGAVLALGSDQHAVLDPYLEMRALEHGERLRSGVRGRFAPTELSAAIRDGGLRSLGLPENDDHLLVRTTSARTAGSRPGQLPLTATAADVEAVVVNGVEIARAGIHTTLGDPAELYRSFLVDHPEFA